MSEPNASYYGGTWHGGHRHRYEKPTAERLEHEAQIDERLAALLGGVPRAPRPRPPAGIIPMPSRYTSTEAVAA